MLSRILSSVSHLLAFAITGNQYISFKIHIVFTFAISNKHDRSVQNLYFPRMGRFQSYVISMNMK